MPEPVGHRPEFAAFTARFPASARTMVFCQFGIRGAAGAHLDAARRALDGLLGSEAGPVLVDRAVDISTAASGQQLALAYWDDQAAYDRWWASPEVADWWRDTEADDAVAHWRAVAVIPVERFESLHSAEALDNGVSHFVPIELTDKHEYWGGMRDRIADSSHDALEPVQRMATAETIGNRVSFVNPGNLCLIRTAQDWSRCAGNERAVYRVDVEPTLRAAADLLATDVSTGCLAASYLQELGADWVAPIERSCVIAWWTSLAHLEQWTIHHLTHKAIFGSFYRLLAAAEDGDSALHLWHEVCVLPEGAVTFEFVNCTPPEHLLSGAAATHRG